MIKTKFLNTVFLTVAVKNLSKPFAFKDNLLEQFVRTIWSRAAKYIENLLSVQ